MVAILQEERDKLSDKVRRGEGGELDSKWSCLLKKVQRNSLCLHEQLSVVSLERKGASDKRDALVSQLYQEIEETKRLEKEVRRAKAKTKLTADDKRMIARRKVETGHSEDMVAVWFKLKTGKEIHLSIVGKYVRAGFHEMDIDGPEAKRCRRRGPKWPLLDLGLFSWFSSVRERNGVLSDALLLTKAAELAQELGIRLSTSSSNPNSSHHQSVPVTSTPSSSQPVAAPPTVSSQPVAATPPVNRQPVIMTAIPPVSHQPVAATPPVNNQLVTATPPVNRQPVIMTAIPPVSHQPVAATPPVNNQLMTATPPVNHQPVTATPQVSCQSMTATPTISSQPMAATPTVSSRQLSPTASSNDDLTVDGQLILSNGWLSRWKGRHGVFSVRLHGEAGGADQQGVARAQRELPGIIEKYRPEDVFNIDETGLFYRQAPDRTLTTTADVRGAKKAKDRITVALAVNVTASERLKPVVIHKYKKPRCFGRTFNPNSLVMYYSNTNAWMRTDVFTDWSKQVNEQFKQQNRQCLMLLDNASSHHLSDTPMIKVGSFDCFKLSNLLLLFFPANCTSVVQPLDQGVIAVLKARYKSKLATHMVTQYDIDPTQDLRALSSKTDVKEAIIWLLAAWGEITPSTIVNCWCKAGILPAEWCHRLRPDRAAVAVAEATEGAQLTAITTAIQRLPVENGTTRMSATEWVNAPGEMEIEGAETIAQIAARLMGRDNEDRDDESDGEADPNNVEPRTVPLEEAKRSALSLAQFVGDNIALFTEADYRALLLLAEKVQAIH
ncbi:hypothetical protein EMCRGX_G007093 [Ephydatia muelleri]